MIEAESVARRIEENAGGRFERDARILAERLLRWLEHRTPEAAPEIRKSRAYGGARSRPLR